MHTALMGCEPTSVVLGWWSEVNNLNHSTNKAPHYIEQPQQLLSSPIND